MAESARACPRCIGEHPIHKYIWQCPIRFGSCVHLGNKIGNEIKHITLVFRSILGGRWRVRIGEVCNLLDSRATFFPCVANRYYTGNYHTQIRKWTPEISRFRHTIGSTNTCVDGYTPPEYKFNPNIVVSVIYVLVFLPETDFFPQP